MMPVGSDGGSSSSPLDQFSKTAGSSAANSDRRWKYKEDAADQNFDFMFKLLIIGNSSVGKTSFLFRFSDDTFSSAFVSTVGIDFKVKTIISNGKRIKLQIWVSKKCGVD